MLEIIKSDDPQAIEKLTHKLLKLELERLEIKHIKALLKNGKGLNDPEIKESGYYQTIALQFRNHGKVEIPAWFTTKMSTNIRSIKQRIESLKDLQARTPHADQTFGSITLVKNQELNRVQLIFDGKPAPEVIKDLKSNGFKWSPTQGLWHRQTNNAALYHAKRIAEQYATV